MNYCVYVIDRMKDVAKVVDYLVVGSPHHVRSYFWRWCVCVWGGIEIEQLYRGDRNRKNLFNI